MGIQYVKSYQTNCSLVPGPTPLLFPGLPHSCSRAYPALVPGPTLLLLPGLPRSCSRAYPALAPGPTPLLFPGLPHSCSRAYPTLALWFALTIIRGRRRAAKMGKTWGIHHVSDIRWMRGGCGRGAGLHSQFCQSSISSSSSWLGLSTSLLVQT